MRLDTTPDDKPRNATILITTPKKCCFVLRNPGPIFSPLPPRRHAVGQPDLARTANPGLEAIGSQAQKQCAEWKLCLGCSSCNAGSCTAQQAKFRCKRPCCCCYVEPEQKEAGPFLHLPCSKRRRPQESPLRQPIRSDSERSELRRVRCRLEGRRRRPGHQEGEEEGEEEEGEEGEENEASSC